MISHPHPQTPQQPPEPSQAQKTNSKAAKPHNHTYNPLSSKTQAAPKRPPSKPNQKTSEALTQTTSTHIRSPSHTPHQHTSEAHLSSHISIHPKLISQATSAYIRSSSLKSHQRTSEALLSSHTKQSPELRISINQSISQPIRPTIFFHNYNPKSSKNKFKYYTKTLQYIQTSLYSPIPSRQPPKKLTPPTSSAAPMPHHLPAHHKETQPLQPSSAALMAHHLPSDHHTSHLQKTRTDRLPAGRLHGRDPVRRSKPLVILGAWGF